MLACLSLLSSLATTGKMSVLCRVSRPPGKTLLSLAQSPAQARYSSVTETKKWKKLKETQARMQIEDGVPVYLKNGTPDKILYYSNVAVMAFGGLMSLHFFWKQATKKE